jgi:hypothetical protein
MEKIQLSEASLSYKMLASLLLLTVAVGYVFGVINIYNNTGFSYTGITTHYRGDAEEAGLPKEFVFAKLIHEHHIHIFSLAILFYLVGSIFVHTRFHDSVKAIFISIPFAGMFLDITSFWLLAFVSPFFAFLAILFGSCMAIAFFLLLGRPLYEMWILPVWVHRWGVGKVPWFLK